MLFSSYEFLFLFLPASFIAFYAAVRFSPVAAIAVLVGASLVFYGQWRARDVVILLVSISLNLLVAKWLLGSPAAQVRQRRRIFALGIAIDLALLGYFKYLVFLGQIASDVLGVHWQLSPARLPLGISFFTFTQIAFLAEVYRGQIKRFDSRDYALFVSYFPHLIAGPIIRYQAVVPQFAAWTSKHINWEGVAAGLAIFSIGLAKKVLLADSVGPFASTMFDAATQDGIAPTLVEAWGGALCFTLQLYFDFSGYSDMAIGLSRLFGVNLPVNFDSPYKSVSIIEFWRRWHMTLSAFLRDYLYIPLGGSRHGRFRRYVNLMITMLLGGLWHGAAWTFVVWGVLHGLFLVVNHAWRGLRRRLGADLENTSCLGRTAARLVTFLCVVVAWVLFRSADFTTAHKVLLGMAGLHGIVLPDSLSSVAQLLGKSTGSLSLLGDGEGWWIAALLSIAWLMPNSNQLVPIERSRPLPKILAPLAWRVNLAHGIAAGLLLGAAIARFSSVRFLYFNF